MVRLLPQAQLREFKNMDILKLISMYTKRRDLSLLLSRVVMNSKNSIIHHLLGWYQKRNPKTWILEDNLG
jgi:hypothetical protein